MIPVFLPFIQAFPGNGVPGNVYIGRIDYWKEGHQHLDKVKEALENDQYISEGTVNSWFHQYDKWLRLNHAADLEVGFTNNTTCKLKDEKRFYDLLNVFLNGDGKLYKPSIIIQTDGRIRVSKLMF